MLINFFAVAIRNLKKYRLFTLINVFGLAVGITACLVILLYVRYELSFDKFNTNVDRIYRVDWNLLFGENTSHRAAVTPPMAEVLVHDYPEIETAARFRFMGSFQFKRETDNITESRVVYADNEIFTIFTLPFVTGDPASALTEPNTMVITQKCAQQFFPGQNALGQTLLVDNKTLYTVTGVIKDVPENSHFHYKIFLSMEGLDEARNGNWIGGPFNTYVLLRPDAHAKQLEAKLPAMVENYLVPQAGSILGSAFMDEFRKGGNSLTLNLRPLSDIHLHSHLDNELEANSDIDYIYLLGGIALFILLIACINFMNLTTARSVNRAREVGVRKALGSTRRKITVQFLAESTILSVLACLIALAAVNVVMPMFNAITELNLTFPFGDLQLLISILGAAILLGIISGIYPGVVISSYQPAKVLKGSFIKGQGSASVRSGLVVFQFALSISLMIGTAALYRQMNFLQEQKLGFKKENVVLMHNVSNANSILTSFKEEMLKNSFIMNGTISSYFPGPGSARKTPLFWKYGTSPSPENSLNLEKWSADYDYIPTLGIELVSGRIFSKAFPSDSTAVILNESAVKKFGLGNDAIGQKISMFYENPDGSQDRSRVETWTIIGVMKDFNFESLRENVGPLGLFFGQSSSLVAFRYESQNTQQLISALKQQWNKLLPGEPFNYSFLDKKFEQLYHTESKLGRIFIVFSVLAIVIACLGLFALTAFMAEQRRKEIGIRKVLGAKSQDIIVLLSLKFSRLILIAFVLAVPLAAMGVNWYLQQYAYKTDISTSIYLAAGATAFLLAFFTMAYQSVRAAHENPVNALRSE